jgi:hypothetical protein
MLRKTERALLLQKRSQARRTSSGANNLQASAGFTTQPSAAFRRLLKAADGSMVLLLGTSQETHSFT